LTLARTLDSFRATQPSNVNLTKYGLIQSGRDNFQLVLNSA
jgi:hypothetical protein